MTQAERQNAGEFFAATDRKEWKAIIAYSQS
jgi:hypothetical protein